MQTGDAAEEGSLGAAVAAAAAQRAATAGQSAHRLRRPATAVAARQTVPPRKPAMPAKGKPAPASAPSEVILSNLLANVLSQ